MPFVAGQRLTAAALNAAFTGTMQLISKQVITGLQPSVFFGSIPQTYTNLRLVISAQSSGTGTTGYDSMNMQFNGVSTLTYNWNSIFNMQGSSAITAVSATASNAMQCGEIWNTHFASAGRGIATIEMPNYADATNCKTFSSTVAASDSGTAGILQFYTGTAAGTAAITSLTLSITGALNFLADSTFCLYGY